MLKKCGKYISVVAVIVVKAIRGILLNSKNMEASSSCDDLFNIIEAFDIDITEILEKTAGQREANAAKEALLSRNSNFQLNHEMAPKTQQKLPLEKNLHERRFREVCDKIKFKRRVTSATKLIPIDQVKKTHCKPCSKASKPLKSILKNRASEQTIPNDVPKLREFPVEIPLERVKKARPVQTQKFIPVVSPVRNSLPKAISYEPFISEGIKIPGFHSSLPSNDSTLLPEENRITITFVPPQSSFPQSPLLQDEVVVVEDSDDANESLLNPPQIKRVRRHRGGRLVRKRRLCKLNRLLKKFLKENNIKEIEKILNEIKKCLAVKGPRIPQLP